MLPEVATLSGKNCVRAQACKLTACTKLFFKLEHTLKLVNANYILVRLTTANLMYNSTRQSSAINFSLAHLIKMLVNDNDILTR